MNVSNYWRGYNYDNRKISMWMQNCMPYSIGRWRGKGGPGANSPDYSAAWGRPPARRGCHSRTGGQVRDLQNVKIRNLLRSIILKFINLSCLFLTLLLITVQLLNCLKLPIQLVTFFNFASKIESLKSTSIQK